MIVSCLSYSFVWCCLLTVLAFLYCIHIDIDNFIIFLVFCSLIVRCCVLSAINKSITYLLTYLPCKPNELLPYS